MVDLFLGQILYVSGKQALSQITSNKTWFPWRSHPALQVLPSPASMDKSDNYFRFMESENSGGHSLINTNIVTDLLYLSWGVVCFVLFQYSFRTPVYDTK